LHANAEATIAQIKSRDESPLKEIFE